MFIDWFYCGTSAPWAGNAERDDLVRHLTEVFSIKCNGNHRDFPVRYVYLRGDDLGLIDFKTQSLVRRMTSLFTERLLCPVAALKSITLVRAIVVNLERHVVP